MNAILRTKEATQECGIVDALRCALGLEVIILYCAGQVGAGKPLQECVEGAVGPDSDCFDCICSAIESAGFVC